MILETVKKYFSKASGYPCRFYTSEHTQECVLYLDTELKINQGIDNTERVFYVSGKIFFIASKHSCSSLNEVNLMKITDKMKECEFHSAIIVRSVKEGLKYSIDFLSLPIHEKTYTQDNGIIKKVVYMINNQQY